MIVGKHLFLIDIMLKFEMVNCPAEWESRHWLILIWNNQMMMMLTLYNRVSLAFLLNVWRVGHCSSVSI